MKALVVDDHPDIVNVVASAVRALGHPADGAGNGCEAMERLLAHPYDVLITDAEMPGADGAALCGFVKLQFPNVHVVGMSGNLYALKGLRDAGAHVCLFKPFGLDELKDALENRA